MTFVQRLQKYSMTKAGGLTETSVMEALETLAEGLDEVFPEGNPPPSKTSPANHSAVGFVLGDDDEARYEALKGFNSLLIGLEKAMNSQ